MTFGTTPTTLDYSSNVYLAVSLTSSSVYQYNPIEIPSFPTVSQVGVVGELSNVLLLAVPKDEWQNDGPAILERLKEDKDNVARVDVQQPKRRLKRGGGTQAESEPEPVAQPEHDEL
jgi:hypothetical protein